MYLYEFSTECIAGEAMIECRVWRILNRANGVLHVIDCGAVFAGTVEEAVTEARDIAAEDAASLEFRG